MATLTPRLVKVGMAAVLLGVAVMATVEVSRYPAMARLFPLAVAIMLVAAALIDLLTEVAVQRRSDGGAPGATASSPPSASQGSDPGETGAKRIPGESDDLVREGAQGAGQPVSGVGPSLTWRRWALFGLLLFGFFVLCRIIGFVPSAIVLVTVFPALMGGRVDIHSAGVAVGLVGSLYVVFVRFLQVPLP